MKHSVVVGYFRGKVREVSLRLRIYKWVRLVSMRIFGGDYRQVELTFFRELLHPGDLVFDVGANRGQSTEVFLRQGCRVISFEPQCHLHLEIQQVCSRLGEFTVDSDGLGAVKEQRSLFLTDFDQTASLRRDWQGRRVGEKVVTISTLDEKIALYGMPRYCKVDVEGWELEVLSGLSQSIEVFSFEFHVCGDELLRTKAVVERITKLACYRFNVRMPGAVGFHLPEFISADEFLALSLKEFWETLPCDFGDVFCVRD